MKSFLIIKAGRSFESIIDKYGDFDEFTINAFPNRPDNIMICEAPNMPSYPSVDELSGVIITGAHENTTDNEPWMIHLKQWIKEVSVSELPLLGICFGHQIVAEALGGVVGFNTAGGEFGVVSVQSFSTNTNLLNLPKSFSVFASHYQSVVKLPEGAVSIAGNLIEPNHVVQYTNRIIGLQFHPEFNRFIMQVHQHENANKGGKVADDVYSNVESFGEELLGQFYSVVIS